VTGTDVQVFWSRLYAHSYALRWPADLATRCAFPGTGPGVASRTALFRKVTFFTAIPVLWISDPPRSGWRGGTVSVTDAGQTTAETD